MTWPSSLVPIRPYGTSPTATELHAHSAKRRHGLGVPFNMTQYAVLIHLIAQSAGLRPGLFTHVINNAHIYENHSKP